jgi:hypothetical protein
MFPHGQYMKISVNIRDMPSGKLDIKSAAVDTAIIIGNHRLYYVKEF